MYGKRWAALLAALLAVKGAGLLPRSREPEERQLVSALGVDGGERISVTAVTAVRVTEDEEPEVLTGTGESLAQACRELRKGSARRAYLGQTEQLLMGEDQDLRELMDYVLTDRELRLDTLFYIVKGSAGEALEASADRVAKETGGRDPRGRTVGELLPRLAEGEYILAPALTPGEGGALENGGWAVLGPGGLEGYLEGEAALGADLLSDLGEGRMVLLPGGTAEVTAVRTWAMDGALFCTLTARKAEGDPEERDLAAWGERVLTAALVSGWDCWGLGREQETLRPGGGTEWGDYPVEELAMKVTGKLVEP